MATTAGPDPAAGGPAGRVGGSAAAPGPGAGAATQPVASILVRFGTDPLSLVTLCLVVSLVARLSGLNLVTTSDEGYWMDRSVRFTGSLLTGDFFGTFRSGHPGVTVMWTGLLGIGPERAQAHFIPAYASAPALERAPLYETMLTGARTSMTMIVSVVLALAGFLAWRLLGAPGALGAILLVLDPYVVGMTRLLHVDALLAPLMLVATLAGLVYWLRGRRWPYLVLSGVAAGLALLTKAPGIILPFYFGLVWLWVGRPWEALRARQFRVWLWPLVWLALLVGVYIALWPALWSHPIERMGAVARFVISVGGVPHDWPTYFLGSPTRGDPGLLFYPLAIAFRLGPVVTIGLLLLGEVAIRRRNLAGGEAILWLAIFVGLFAYIMSMGAKKFDRYMLPALLVLDILAGVGVWLFARTLARRWAVTVVAVAVAAQAFWLVWSYPYPIAAYNPLLGGTAGARQVIMVGWGEGLEQAALYLSSLPNAQSLNISTQYHHVIRSRFVGRTTRAPSPRVIDYYVVYVNMVQRDIVPGPVKQTMVLSPPSFTATVNGVPYAWVYRGPWVLDSEQEAPTNVDDETDP